MIPAATPQPQTGRMWITIPRWEGKEGFQHYRDRDPVWIKNYRYLLSSDEYRSLSMAERGVLHGIWLEYARSNRAIRGDTAGLTRRLGQRVTSAQLESLNHAGFIGFSASKPLAPRYHDAIPEKEEEKENPLPPLGETAKPPTQTTPKPRRPKHPDQMTHEEKNPFQCGIGKCPIRHATKWKIEEHREVVHRVPPAQNGHVEPEVTLARADLFGDTEPDLEEE